MPGVASFGQADRVEADDCVQLAPAYIAHHSVKPVTTETRSADCIAVLSNVVPVASAAILVEFAKLAIVRLFVGAYADVNGGIHGVQKSDVLGTVFRGLSTHGEYRVFMGLI